MAHNADMGKMGPEETHYYYMLGTPAGMHKVLFICFEHDWILDLI